MLRSAFIVAVALAAACGAAEARDARFSYSAWELETDGGRQAVMDRIEDAAARSCANGARAGLWEIRASRSCTDSMTADLVEKVGDTRLAGMSRARFASN